MNEEKLNLVTLMENSSIAPNGSINNNNEASNQPISPMVQIKAHLDGGN